MTLAIMFGVIGSVSLLLLAGYLFGVHLGTDARSRLRSENNRLSEDAQRLGRELARRTSQNEHEIRGAIERALAPIVERERTALDLSQIGPENARSRDLVALLDRIAEAGSFASVVLCDDDGLPFASNQTARDADRLAAISTYLNMVSDRMGGDGRPTPLSVMVLDDSNSTTLCRMFAVNERRLALIVSSTGTRLSPTTLDSSIPIVSGMLSHGGASPVGE